MIPESLSKPMMSRHMGAPSIARPEGDSPTSALTNARHSGSWNSFTISESRIRTLDRLRVTVHGKLTGDRNSL